MDEKRDNGPLRRIAALFGDALTLKRDERPSSLGPTIAAAQREFRRLRQEADRAGPPRAA